MKVSSFAERRRDDERRAGEVVHKGQNPPKQEAIAELVEETLLSLSIEQRVAQLVQAELASVSPDDVREHGLGSVLNGGGVFPNGNKHATVAEWRELTHAYHAASRESESGIPILWGTDAVHGHNNVFGSTLFPHNIALGAVNDPDLVRRIGEATARAVADTGIDWTFAPTLAVPCDYRWGRTYEGYSSDPNIVRELGGAMIRGLQGDPESRNFLGEGHVICTAKHFVGEGGTTDGIDQGDTVCDENDLLHIHSYGHIEAMNAGATTVMAAFNSWNGQKVHGSSFLLNEVLKTTLRFNGFVVSDWDGFAQVHEDFDKACVDSYNAGVDMFMVSSDWRRVYAALLEAAKWGIIPRFRLEDSVRRILRVKAMKGLLTAEPSPRLTSMRTASALEQDRLNDVELAREAVRRSLVMLKDPLGQIPMNPELRYVVVGDAASNVAQQCGGWSLTWQGTGNTNADFPNADSIADGFQRVIDKCGGSVEFVDEFEPGMQADVGIVVFGEEPYAEGEGDLNHLSYSRENPKPLAQMRLMREHGIDTIVALFLTGRPRWINPELNAVDTFVVCWLPGTQGGAMADVLFYDETADEYVPLDGKLPFSWPVHSADSSVDHQSTWPSLHFEVGFALEEWEMRKCPEFPEEDETHGPSKRGPSHQGSYNYPNP